jgi:hypothetical protein
MVEYLLVSIMILAFGFVVVRIFMENGFKLWQAFLITASVIMTIYIWIASIGVNDHL